MSEALENKMKGYLLLVCKGGGVITTHQLLLLLLQLFLGDMIELS